MNVEKMPNMSEAAASEVDVSALIDDRPMGRFQWEVVFLCVLVAVLDGFDVQTVAFAAPAIAEDWGRDIAGFGPVFAAALLGMSTGGLLFGPLADRWGRKPILLSTTAVVGLSALGTATADSLTELTVFRFLTGIGLGGAVPNVLALTSEYVPKYRRAFIVTAMYTGFPLGATLGGIVCAPLIERFGWQIVFILGGGLPLLLLPLLAWRLPESIRFLAGREERHDRLGRIAERMSPVPAATVGVIRYVAYARDETQGESASPVRALFRGARARVTLLLWLVFFCNMMVLYFLVNWLPTLLREEGLSLQNAILGAVVLNMGGVAGSLLISYGCDRVDPRRILAIAFGGGALAMLAIGQASGSLVLLLILVCLGGAFVVGAQLAGGAVAAMMYPIFMRATGVSWALSVGRFGSIAGPLIGGWILALGLRPGDLIAGAAVPLVVATVAISALRRPGSATTPNDAARSNGEREAEPEHGLTG